MRSVACAAVLLSLCGVPGLSPASGGSKKDKPSRHKPNNHKPRDLSKGNTMFVVPYAHLDTQWRWAYPQVVREFIVNTLHHNFDLIDKYPNYVFNFSGSRRYEMMKEYYPAEYEKLKAYVKAGKWFPCGSSVDENDANVPSGESIIRHVLYGNHFFRREFGLASEEYMLPDCFGFPYALPTLLAHCGIKGFSTQKLTWNSANGIPFKVGTWEGPDGKSIVAALDPGGYGSRVDEDLSQNTSWLARIQNTGKISGAFVDYKYYGTGDIGGGPSADSVNWVEKSINGDGPISVVSSHADEMVKSLTPDQIAHLPHYKGELLLVEHSAGSISSQAMMKRWNRKNELLADGAERASVAASWLGGAAYPSDRLYKAWVLVLGSQMHDMLPGTSIPKAYEFCWNDELLAQNQFAAIETSAVGAFSAAMDTRGQGTPIVVYNPLSIPRDDVVEATVPITADRIQVYGPDGRPVLAQILVREPSALRILFMANVPATGFAAYEVMPLRAGSRFVSPPEVVGLIHGTAPTASANSIENSRLKVTVNHEGDMASIYDKVNKREVLKSPARLDFQYENPRQFPAWNMDWADQQKPPRAYVHGPAKIRVIENGPVRATIEVERESEGSKFVQDIRLTAGGDKVEVLNKIDWQTKETALKASFPLANGSPKATYDLQVGAIERDNNNAKHFEVPQHQWFDVTKPDGSYGVGILNDSKFASDKPDDNTIRLTLIYTPGTRGGYNDQGTQDIGRHEILFAIAPHAGDWRKGDIPWQGKRLNQPLRAFLAPSHPGLLGKSISLIATNSRQVEISALKKAEDSDEIIVRLRELNGHAASGVRISALGGIVSAREVNGQEQPLGPARLQDGGIVTDVPAFSLKTFAIRLGHPPTHLAGPISQPVPLPYDTDVVSTDKNPGDGAFDNRGHAIAAEQLPAKLTVDGITFKFGPTNDGAKNAVTARGQHIALPAGYNRVYILAASANGDVEDRFAVGKTFSTLKVQDWGGYIGQWDNRLWASDPGPNFTNYGEMAGLTPGFVKSGEVAWFASHQHTPAGNTFYQYTYLYKYGLDIPAGARTIALPNDPAVKIMAVSVAKATHDQARAASPLSDTLTDHVTTGQPSISPSGGTFNDATDVTIAPPLYWHGGGLHYTTDGSSPTAASPTYKGPITLSDPTTIKVAEIDQHGIVGPVTSATINVNDTTPPSVVSASAIKSMGLVRIRFSEKVDKETAENPNSYQFNLPFKPAAAKLSADLRTVDIAFGQSLAGPQSESLMVIGVKDLSKNGNAMKPQMVAITERGAVLSQAQFDPKTTKVLSGANLPVKARDSWTVNFFCKVDNMPEDRTLIAGFGNARDGRTGTGRYFAKFAEGINFWVCNRDLKTTVPLDTGKWQMLTATYDGVTMRLYKNGEKIAEEKIELEDDTSQARVMPIDAWERQRRFQGEVRDFTIWDQDLPADAIRKLYAEGTKP